MQGGRGLICSEWQRIDDKCPSPSQVVWQDQLPHCQPPRLIVRMKWGGTFESRLYINYLSCEEQEDRGRVVGPEENQKVKPQGEPKRWRKILEEGRGWWWLLEVYTRWENTLLCKSGQVTSLLQPCWLTFPCWLTPSKIEVCYLSWEAPSLSGEHIMEQTTFGPVSRAKDTAVGCGEAGKGRWRAVSPDSLQGCEPDSFIWWAV